MIMWELQVFTFKILKLKCTFFRLIRDQILSQDFANNVKILQNYPPTDINIILAKTIAIIDWGLISLTLLSDFSSNLSNEQNEFKTSFVLLQIYTSYFSIQEIKH